MNARKRRWLIEIAVILAIVFAFRAWQTRDAIDGPAPQLNALDLDGAPVSLSRGEPVLVHFWATWCGVCKTEEGSIDGIARDHRVITIAAQSGDAAQVRRYLEERDLSFRTVVDPRGELAHRWGVHAFPASFVIDGDGQVRNVEVGYTTSLGLRLRLWLAHML